MEGEIAMGIDIEQEEQAYAERQAKLAAEFETLADSCGRTVAREIVHLRQRVARLEAEHQTQHHRIQGLEDQVKAVDQFIRGAERLMFQR